MKCLGVKIHRYNFLIWEMIFFRISCTEKLERWKQNKLNIVGKSFWKTLGTKGVVWQVARKEKIQRCEPFILSWVYVKGFANWKVVAERLKNTNLDKLLWARRKPSLQWIQIAGAGGCGWGVVCRESRLALQLGKVRNKRGLII